ncbi:MAG: CHAP domain-containing protein [Eubacteriales bacterium]|nr:CHAP domain-containing protein [Eubacteriales bacterium]MDD3882992.1 CHAP domain-containing protein [Eubacteriales bacterium]MDD4513460.1 CHAP domain-containing protein [Eubacteriales bacterium]
MKRFIACLTALITLLCLPAFAEPETEPTSVPSDYPYTVRVPIPDDEKTYTVPEVTFDGYLIPEEIRNMIDVGLQEYYFEDWNELPISNRYTYDYWGKKKKQNGWCTCFVYYCMKRGVVPLYTNTKQVPEGEDIFGFIGLRIRNISPLYKKVGRQSTVPYPGYLVVYSSLKVQKNVHIGIITDVTLLEDGTTYEIKTVEGNVSNRVKQYRYLYNNADKTDNMFRMEGYEDREGDFQYELHNNRWYVETFLQTWTPGAIEAKEALEAATDAPSAEPTAAETAVTETPAPEADLTQDAE